MRTYPAAYRDRFPGLPAAEHTVYDLIGNAISASKRFIYLEDQYLIANSSMRFGGEPISSLLANKLKDPSFEALVILIARTEWIDFLGELGNPHQGWSRRKDFIDALRNAAPSKVVVCTYKAPIARG